MPSMDRFRYCAFISYSHADARWALWLQSKLERYRIPAHLAGTADASPGRRKLGRVFQDRSELASSSDLGETLKQALTDSEALIVICSPTSAKSRWVNEEIRQFRALGRGDHIFALVVDGIPNADGTQAALECFPLALRQTEDGSPHEPLAADIRPGQDRKADALLKIVAGLLGVGFDDLRRRELQRRNRQLAIFSAGALSIAILTLGLAVLAYRASQEASARRAQAEDLINFMLGDLRNQLEPVGRLDVLDSVGDKAMAYFAQQSAFKPDDNTTAARARALHQMGEIRVLEGRPQEGQRMLDEALVLQRRLAEQRPNEAGAQIALAETLHAAGNAARDTDQADRAESLFREMRQHTSRQQALHPKLQRWTFLGAQADMGVGSLLSAAGDPAAALPYFIAVESPLTALYQASPEDSEFLDALIEALRSQASLLDDLARNEQAQAAYERAAQLARAEVQRAPRDMVRVAKLVDIVADAVDASSRHNQMKIALPLAEEFERLTAELVRHDPQNYEWKGSRGAALYQLSLLKLRLGEVSTAERLLGEALQVREAVFQRDQQQIYPRFRYSEGLLQTADYALLRGDRQTAITHAERALALWNGQETAFPAWRTALRAHIMAWELAINDPVRVKQQRAAAEKLMQLVEPARTLAYIDEMFVRHRYLTGDYIAAAQDLSQLEAAGYRSPALDRFVRDACRRAGPDAGAACSRVKRG